MILWREWNRKSTTYYACRSFVKWYTERYPIKHTVYLYGPARIYGMFIAPARRGLETHTALVIYLMLPMRHKGVIYTLAHELVHYEQHRTRRPINERNVDRRAAALVRAWRRDQSSG